MNKTPQSARKLKTATPSAVPLVKNALADRLRQEIMQGGLTPGLRIIEGPWARKMGVAQGSIREAINILAQEGFVTKAAGRSARVVSLSESDVLQIYELRGAVEGLAARLAADRSVDTAKLDKAVAAMRRAAKEGDCQHLLDSDLAFHLELCQLSGNIYVQEQARRMLLPLFAFARIRVITNHQGISAWDRDLEAHQRIVDLIREGEGRVAEQYVHQVMARFAATAYENWERKVVLQKHIYSVRQTG